MPTPAGWVLAPPIGIEAAAYHAYKAGFRGEPGAEIVAIADAETDLIPNHRNVNRDGSIDRGILQFNSRHHPEVTDAQADDPAQAFEAAYTVSSGGTSFTPWAVYGGQRFQDRLTGARLAFAKVAGQAGPDGALPGALAELGADVVSSPIPGSLAEVPAGPLTVEELRIRGQAFADSDIAPWVSSAVLELSVDEASQLTFTIADPLNLLQQRGATLVVGVDLDLGSLRFRVTDIRRRPSSGALEEMEVVALAAGVEELRKADRQGESRTWQQMTSAQVLGEEAGRVGLAVVAQGGPVYSSITRLGRNESAGTGEVTAERKKRAESTWELADRLAKHERCWRFEAGDTLYFGRPTWLVARLTRFHVRWREQPGDGYLVPLVAPQLTAGVDEDDPARLPGQRTISVALPRGLADRIRPGMVMLYDGTWGWASQPYNTEFGAPDGYLVTKVTVDLLDVGAPVQVDAREAKDPDPESGTSEFDETPSSATEPSGAPRSTSTAVALDMVTRALSQVGKPYVYGAEVDPKDPSPWAFDCSELVQWACGQVGVDFVDGSEAQIAACSPIPVDNASVVRGALLWIPGHIAISLGDGVRTIEARGRDYGVNMQSIATIGWQKAGLIPGLDYGPSVAFGPLAI